MNLYLWLKAVLFVDFGIRAASPKVAKLRESCKVACHVKFRYSCAARRATAAARVRAPRRHGGPGGAPAGGQRRGGVHRRGRR